MYCPNRIFTCMFDGMTTSFKGEYIMKNFTCSPNVGSSYFHLFSHTTSTKYTLPHLFHPKPSRFKLIRSLNSLSNYQTSFQILAAKCCIFQQIKSKIDVKIGVKRSHVYQYQATCVHFLAHRSTSRMHACALFEAHVCMTYCCRSTQPFEHMFIFSGWPHQKIQYV